MKKHLAIFAPLVIQQIFQGKKTIETRFSQKRIAPFGQVNIGDIIYIKPPGEDIKGQFLVKKVISIEGVTSKDIENIRTEYGDKISLGSEESDQKFFKNHKDAKFATLIFIDGVEQLITSPIKYTKKDLRGWAVLNQG